MELELFDRGVRLVLAGVAVTAALACGIAWRRRAVGPVAVGVALGGLALLALVAEQLLARAIAATLPTETAWNDWRWVLESPWSRSARAAGIAAAAAVLLLALRDTARERRPVRRATLLLLRGGACCGALVLFLAPALEVRQVAREPNRIAVLVDDSRSMSIAETTGGPTRADRAAAAIRASQAAFAAWRTTRRVDFFTFSDGLLPVSETELALSRPARGDATLLGEALQSLRARYEAHELAGIVVLSDGIATGKLAEDAAGAATTELLTGLDAQVHTLFAAEGTLRDLAVARLDVDELAFARTVQTVEATITATGLPTQEVPVTLRRDGVVVRETRVTVGGNRESARVTFEVVPERVGQQVLEVSVPLLAGEAIATNNARLAVVRVTRDRLRVLQIAGRPSWDVRALRGALESDPNVDLVSFFILRTPDDIQLVPPEEMSLIPFPTDELFGQELGSFDVVVMMNFEPGPYGIAPYLDQLARFVVGGGGLAVVGGDLAFSSGGYAGTPLAALLPVTLLPDGPAAAITSTSEFHPVVPALGQRHPILAFRLDPRENLARLASLPPLEGQNLVAGPGPGAQVLLEHPTLRTRAGLPMPVMATRDHGAGRTLAVLTDSTWRWGLVAAGREGDDGRAHATFWDRALRWLIRDPDLDHLRLEPDHTAYDPGVPITLAARLYGADYLPAAGATVDVELGLATADTPPTWRAKLTLDADGHAHAAPPTLAPGAYRAVARADLAGHAISATALFLVRAESAELSRPAADDALLRQISSATAGQFLGAASSLPLDLPFAPLRVVRVDRRLELELWSEPMIQLLTLGLLMAEWTLRRSSGLL